MTDTSRPAIDPRFGRTLRQLREARGLSQEALASRALYSKGYVGLLEQHVRPPTAQVAARLDAALQAHGELATTLTAVPIADEEEAMTPSQFAQEVAAHLLKSGFADLVADKVAERVDTDLEMFSMQGWWTEHVHPAWSGYCWNGEHDQCNGNAAPGDKCHCPHHDGEPIPEWGYRLQIDDNGLIYSEPRTEPPPRLRKREPQE